MSDATRKIRLVKSENREEGPSRGLPDALDLEFVYPDHSVVVADEGPDSYIHAVHGKIEFSSAYQDMETGEFGTWRTEAGRFRALYVDAVLARGEGQRVCDVMSAESPEMADMCRALFAPGTDGFRNEVTEILQNPVDGNILVVLGVEILPGHRGMGLGLAALWYVIRLHSAGCGLVVLKAFPGQHAPGFDPGRDDWTRRMAYPPAAGGMEEAQRKLVAWCGKLGFRQVGGRGTMAFPTAARNPVPKEIRHWVPRQALPAESREGARQKGIPTAVLVGMNLRRLREGKGLSQLELAGKLGVTAIHINNVESGLKGVGLDRIEKWARLLDVPIAEFFLPG
jgi:DNA-binding XRE family transcriptional regulator